MTPTGSSTSGTAKAFRRAISGSSWRRFRNIEATARCLLSVVDRTVEVQSERALRAEMLRDSLTGLPNRLSFTETIEQAGEKVARDLEHAVLVVDVLRFSAGSTRAWGALPATSC